MSHSNSGTDGRKSRNERLCKHVDVLGWSIRGFARRVRERCHMVGLQPTASPCDSSRHHRLLYRTSVR